MARRDEPDDGGLDWLQSQLGAASEQDESVETGASDEPEPVAPEEPAWFASLPKRTEPASPRAAEPPAAPDPSGRTAAGGEAAGSEAAPPPTPAFEIAEPPTAKFETAKSETPGAEPSSASASDPEPVTDARAPASAFSWGLTPSNDPDPKVAPRVQPRPTPLPEPGPAPTAPAAPAPTPAATTPAPAAPTTPVPAPASAAPEPSESAALPETASEQPLAPEPGAWSLGAADAQAPVPAESPVPTTPIVPPVLPPAAPSAAPPTAPPFAPIDETETDTLGPESLTPAAGADLGGADHGIADRGIRTEADLEPEPWWTTPVQAPLVPTDEERNAGLFPTPVAATPTTPAPATPTPGQTTPATQLPSAASVGVTGNDGHAAPRRGRRGQTPPSSPTGGAGTGRTDNPKSTRTLIWVAVALGVVIVLIGLFFLGRQLVGGTPVAAPSPSPTATPTPTPTPPPAPTAPQPAGVHAWDTLFGSECVEPYASPWDEEFTVVDCATPHTAQLVYRGAFPGDATTAFPGEAALAAQINALCSAPGVIDLAAAGGFPDLQLQGSYPISDEQWTSGQRNFYCFVSRSSGEPLTASIAGPGPAPAA